MKRLLSSLILMLCSSSVLAAALPPLNGLDLISEKTLTINWQDNKKGSVIVFLSSQCPCSNAHIEHIIDLKKTFPDIHFYGIHSNVNEALEKSKSYFKQKLLPFPVIKDNSSEWADRLKAFRTPHAYLITPEGTVAYQGGVTSSADPAKADSFYLKVILKKFLTGQKIDQSRSRVLGCEIARK